MNFTFPKTPIANIAPCSYFCTVHGETPGGFYRRSARQIKGKVVFHFVHKGFRFSIEAVRCTSGRLFYYLQK